MTKKFTYPQPFEFRELSYSPVYDGKSDFNTNAKSYYDYLARVNEYLKYMGFKLQDYENILNERLDYLDEKLENFDPIVMELLEKWIDDGTFADIINYEIFNRKADKEYVDSEFYNINSHLNEIENRLQHVNFEMFRREGMTDGEVIKATHDFANQHGLEVINLTGEYYLDEPLNIEVKTSFNYGNTIFYIDESKSNSTDIHFIISPSKDPINIELSQMVKNSLVGKLKKGVTLLPELSPYKNYLIHVTDINKQVARRSHSGGGTIWNNEEFFYIGEGGSVEGEVFWDFDNYTSLVGYYAEESYLIGQGGIFLLNGQPPNTSANYIFSGYRIRRSRVIIKNQYIGLQENATDNFPLSNVSVGSFYQYNYLYDLTFDGIRSLPRKAGQRGTYSFEGSYILNLTFSDVNGYGDLSNNYWGITGHNKIKNLTVKNGSYMNRIDVHFDGRNVSVENSTIGRLALNGGGKLLVDKTTVIGNLIIQLRSDYGGSWDGDIEVNDVTMIPTENASVHITRFDRIDFDHILQSVAGRRISINNVHVDFSNFPNFSHMNQLVYLNGFGRFQYNDKLYRELNVKNVKCNNLNESSKTGFMLMRIDAPYLLRGGKEVNFSPTMDIEDLETNVTMRFENVDVFKGYGTGQEVSTASLYFAVNSQKEFSQYTADSVFPYVKIIDCENLKIHPKGSFAIIEIVGGELNQLDAFEDGLTNSKITLRDTDIRVKTTESSTIDSRQLYPSYNTNLINCTLYPSVYSDGVSLAKTLNRNGLFVFYTNDLKIEKQVKTATGIVLSERLKNYLDSVIGGFDLDEFTHIITKFSDQRQTVWIERGEKRPVMHNVRYAIGHMFFDKTLNKPIWWTGINWIDSEGNIV